MTRRERVKRHVRSRRRVDRGPQLRLILDASALHSSAEINNGLSLGDDAQIICKTDKRLQFPIGVENVVLGFVGSESGSGVRVVVRIGVRISCRSVGEAFAGPTGETCVRCCYATAPELLVKAMDGIESFVRSLK